MTQNERENPYVHGAPVFRHDCARCVFLGTVRTKDQSYGGVYDLYWCANDRHPNMSSVIARHGDEGAEYGSTLPPEAFAGPEEVIAQWREHGEPYLLALTHATRMGLYGGRYKHMFTDSAESGEKV